MSNNKLLTKIHYDKRRLKIKQVHDNLLTNISLQCMI